MSCCNLAFNAIDDSYLQNSQSFQSPLRSTDFRSLRDVIKEIFNKARTEHLQLVFPDLGYFDIAEKISRENSQGKQTATKTKVEIIADIEGKRREVGKIDFWFRVGKCQLADEETSHFKQEDYFAYLDYIEIKPEFQGKGFSSVALRLWHNCIDELNLPLTILGVSSKIPYAAMTYKKAGYEFTKATINHLTDWYRGLPESERVIEPTKRLGDEILQSQNEYLANSARGLGEGHTAFMIRFKR